MIMTLRISKAAASVASVVGLVSLVMVGAAQGALSPSTGGIEGRAPTASGNLQVQDGSGNVVAQNSLLVPTQTPNDFKVSGETSGLSLSDLDGDCASVSGPCQAVVNTGAGSVVWSYNGSGLNATMLASPFQTYFSGKTLTVKVTAPVTTSSVTGTPRSRTQTLSSQDTQVIVPLIPGILVGPPPGTYRWDVSKKFPTTAALGLQFTLNLANGSGTAQTDFTWSVNQPWVTVDSNGVITITAAPTRATQTVTVTATEKANSANKITYTFTVNKWFGTVRKSGYEPIQQGFEPNATLNGFCQSKGAGWRAAGYGFDIKGQGDASTYRRVPGAMFAEWGSVHPSGWSKRDDGSVEGVSFIDTLVLPASDGGGSGAVALGYTVAVPFGTGATTGASLMNPDGFSKPYVFGSSLSTTTLINRNTGVDVMCVLDI